MASPDLGKYNPTREILEPFWHVFKVRVIKKHVFFAIVICMQKYVSENVRIRIGKWQIFLTNKKVRMSGVFMNWKEYISKLYAKKTIQDIMEKTDILEAHPFIGRAIPELNDKAIREIAHLSYRIIYQLLDEQIYILAISQILSFKVNFTLLKK